MAPEPIASGNPAWLTVADEEVDNVGGDLEIEEMRHGPSTVASIVLKLDNAEAGTELTFGDVLATIKALESIAAQAVIDGYGIPNQLVPSATGTPWLRDDALPEGGPFTQYLYARVGEIANEKVFGKPEEGSSIERLDGRQEFDEEAYDRISWTLYGTLEDGTDEALFDADTEEEVARVARLLPGPVYRVDDGAWTLVQGA